jgi:hypothetical protein
MVKKLPRVIIEIEGGNIQGAYVENGGAELIVYDFDNIKEGGEPAVRVGEATSSHILDAIETKLRTRGLTYPDERGKCRSCGADVLNPPFRACRVKSIHAEVADVVI